MPQDVVSDKPPVGGATEFPDPPSKRCSGAVVGEGGRSQGPKGRGAGKNLSKNNLRKAKYVNIHKYMINNNALWIELIC